MMCHCTLPHTYTGRSTSGRRADIGTPLPRTYTGQSPAQYPAPQEEFALPWPLSWVPQAGAILEVLG